jgi:L-iditol 2-dehydrogenase
MSTLLKSTVNATMKAALFYEPGDVRYVDMAMPVPGAGELVIEMKAALTCGTDLKAFRRGHPVLLKNTPSPFGHEGAGVVSAIGEGVTRFAVGDRVVAANSAPCMHCFYCYKGKYNLCEDLDLLNGTYAQYLKIPARIVRKNTLAIPEGIAFEAAAFSEPLSVSLRCIDACGIRPGDTVAVIGLGAIGQMILKLAKLKGATTVGLGRNPLKRETARTFAEADVVVDLKEYTDPQQIVKDFSPEGRGFDVVIEAVGLPVTWENAIQMVRRGGVVNLFGGCESGTRISLDTHRLHYDEITLLSLFHHTPEYFRMAMEYISTGLLDPTPLISLELPLHCVTEALELVAEGKAIKVALKPDA